MVTRGHALVVRRAALSILEDWREALWLGVDVSTLRRSAEWVELEILEAAIVRLGG